MKNTIKSSFVLGIALTIFSFVNSPAFDFTGTYGVSENDPAKIELIINEDHTFTYKDFSNKDKKIDVNGNWELKNKHIVLVNYTSEFSFHDKWKVIENGKALKSRKGMTFYTLVKECK